MKKSITKLMAALALLLFVAPPLVGWGQTRGSLTVSYGWEDNDDATNWTITEAIAKTSDQGNTGTYAGKINTNHTYVQFNQKVAVTSFSFAFKRTSNNSNYNVYIETSTDGTTWTAVETYAMSSFLNGTYTTKSHTFDGTTEYYVRFHCYNTTAVRYVDDVSITYNSGSAPTVATPSFNPEAGAYTSAQNVEISTTTEGATIHYTVDGTEPTTGSSVYSTPIAVTETTTIKAMAVKDGFDNSAVASATYTIISFEHQGTAEDPYSVADAHTAIDANIGTAGVYATGIVSAIPTAYNSTYGNITFNMVDEEGDEVFLQAYRCAGNEAANVAVGDIAVVFGDLTKYNSTYEFGQGCQLVSLEHPTVTDPYITANNVEIAYDATSGEISYTLNNPVAEGSLSVAEEVDWISNAALNTNLSKVTFDCEANPNAASRSGVVTITYTYGNNSTSKEVTVTQTGNPDVFNNISDITQVGTAYSVRGTVVATNSRGFIMGDGTGYVYYYKNATPTQTVGDMVKVSGTTGTYGQIIQFTNTAIVTEASVSNYNGTPSATVITEIPDYTQGYHLSTYLEFEGALAKDGSNYLITLGNAQIQISYPNTEQGNALTALNGKQVHVKGYFSGINSSSRFTVMLESVEEVVVAEPTITLSDSGTLNIGNYPVGGEITRTFTVEQNNLTEGITLTANNGGSLNPESIEQGAEATEVTWTFIPTEAGQFSSTITATSGQTTAQFTYMGYAKTVHNVMIDQNIVNGEVSAEPTTGIEGDYITLYVTPAEGYELEALTIVDANSAPINYTDFETYYRFQMPDSDVTVNATFVEAVETHWVLSSLADLTANDVFIIVSTKGNDNYAMSNDKGASAAPTAVAVTVEDNAITSTVASNIQWTGITGDATDGYIIYSNADNTKYLYCINNNNGVRVGNGADSTFIIKDNYIYNILQGRYLGVYNNADWRCYTTIHNNIKDQTFAFYKKTIGALPPSISAEDYEITFDTDADELEYVINNPVEGGVLTAATTSDWLTVGNITGNSVEFTCTLNGDTYVARTAVVTLTYTYGEQSTTKDVTVTQTGNMAVFDLVSSITEVGGYYHVKGQVLAISSRGFVIGDSTAYVYTYMGTTSFNYAVGDEVAILGTTGTYGQIIQFTNQASIDTISNVQYNGQPYPEVITAVPDYSEGYHLSTYFEFEGVLVKPTSNYYVRLSATDSICISYPTETQQTAYDALLGNNVHVYGFFAGISSSTGFTVIVESLAESVHYAINVTPDLIELESNEAANGALEVTYQYFDASQISDAFPLFYTPDGNGGYIPFGEEDDPDWISITFAAQFDTIYYTVEANDTDEARTAYFQYTVSPAFNPGAYIYSNMITISQPAYVAPVLSNNFELFTGNLVEGDYLIVYDNGAMNNIVDNSRLQFAAVTPENDVITTDNAAIIWHIAPSGNYWTIYSADANAYAASTGVKNKAQLLDDGADDKALWTASENRSFEFVNKYNAEHNVNANLRKNGTYGFACYATSTGGALSLYKRQESTPPVASITVTPNVVEVDADEHDGTLDLAYENLTITEMTDFDIQYYDAQGQELNGDDVPAWIEVLVAEQDPTIGEGYVVSYYMFENEGEARTAYFKVYAMDDESNLVYSNLVTINQDANVEPLTGATYTLVTNLNALEPGRRYIITNGINKAMGGQNPNNRAAVDITIDGNVAYVKDGDVAEFVISKYFGVVYNVISIYDANVPGYLYAASSSSNYLRTETLLDADNNGAWTVSFASNGAATVEAEHGNNSRNQMRYNSGSNIFSCYSSGQQPVYFFKKDEEQPEYTFLRDIKGYNGNEGGYSLIASPVIEDVNPENVPNMTVGNYDLYWFDQSQDLEWRNYETESFNLVSGKGYLYANHDDVTLAFTGTPGASTIQTVSLTYDENAVFAGWNLIGNPMRRRAYIDRDYYELNEEGTEIIAGNTYEILPMQGFFVVAEEEGETVTFTPTQDGLVLWPVWDEVVMNVGNGRSIIDRIIVRFGEGRQLPKFQLNENSTKLYIPQGNKDYAVVRSAAQGEMPVNFKASKNGTYTIAIDAKNVEMNYLHLIDNMTGDDVDLLATPSYSFEAKTTDYASRFKLVFSANDEEGSSTSSETFAFFNGSVWCISNMGKATLQVVDVLGHIVSSETVNGNAVVSTDNLTKGVYMFRLVNGENVKVQKVVVK